MIRKHHRLITIEVVTASCAELLETMVDIIDRIMELREWSPGDERGRCVSVMASDVGDIPYPGTLSDADALRKTLKDLDLR